MTPRPNAVPPAALGARGLWGLLLTTRPGLPLALVGGDERRTRVAARVLGVRHLVEVTLLRDRPVVLVAADGLHALSMVVLATRSRALARVALASAATATGLIAATRPALRPGSRADRR